MGRRKFFDKVGRRKISDEIGKRKISDKEADWEGHNSRYNRNFYKISNELFLPHILNNYSKIQFQIKYFY